MFMVASKDEPKPASQDLIDQIRDDKAIIDSLCYGQITFDVQDGRMIGVKYTVSKRVGKEIKRC